MTERRWRFRELRGVAGATLVLAVPIGALVRLQLAKRWSLATQPGAGISAILLVWALIVVYALVSVRSQ